MLTSQHRSALKRLAEWPTQCRSTKQVPGRPKTKLTWSKYIHIYVQIYLCDCQQQHFIWISISCHIFFIAGMHIYVYLNIFSYNIRFFLFFFCYATHLAPRFKHLLWCFSAVAPDCVHSTGANECLTTFSSSILICGTHDWHSWRLTLSLTIDCYH